MGMYNLLFGMNKFSELILGMIHLRKEDVGRFRDTYIDGDKIVVYTRNGGEKHPGRYRSSRADSSCHHKGYRNFSRSGRTEPKRSSTRENKQGISGENRE